MHDVKRMPACSEAAPIDQSGQIAGHAPVLESSASPCAARRRVSRSMLSGGRDVKLLIISTSRHTCIKSGLDWFKPKRDFKTPAGGMRTGEQRFPTWLRTDSASPEVETSVLPPPGGVSASASLRLWPFLSPVSDPLLISQRNPARAGQTTCSTGHLGIQT